MKKNRRWLYLLLAAGLIALGAGGGTFATFNAQITNKTNTFSTGSLTLTVTGTCKSDGGTNNSNTCSSGELTVATTPGDEATSVVFNTITVTNGGTLTASHFYLAAAEVTGTDYCKTSVSYTGSNTSKLTVGTLNKTSGSAYTLCRKLHLFVEETTQTGATSGGKTDCWYGATGSTCTATGKLHTALVQGTAPGTLSVANLIGTVTSGDKIIVTTKTGAHTQKFTAGTSTTSGTVTTITVTGTKALASFKATSYVVDVTPLTGTHTVSAFDTNYSHTPLTKAEAIRLLPLSSSGTPASATTSADLASGKSRTFLVGVYLGSVTNHYQALTAKFGLTWRITQ